ncbi:mechanosensitive ion channel [Halieaceae bacterium IMCC14734]|uniref:Mechanosensitive ion channel n=1 Tax=Candidatus Litorirhabdus singularis TaxID=2518993 RepID=A0ABT3TGS9_9GAMM|nr:mechanosensitive ion channel domain-containing protein [Candidatus Litorirhabdus singularis]MCX2980971.1 mechanosensitive ion channel [Candidatus Litorirhabdus singularis]
MDEITRILQSPLVIFGESSITLMQILAVILLVLAGGLFVVWSARILRRLLGARRVSPDLVQILSRAWLILGLVVLAFIVLDYLNVPLTAFAFISGAVAIGVGFGAQNIINNFISGWILMWERPIKIGDFLELNEVHGTVESIDTRSTRIRRVDGVHVLVPNSFLLENSVTNWTLVDRLVRTSVRVGVAYGSDVSKVTELLLLAADEHADVLKEPVRAVIFDDFGDSALIFELTVWVNAGAERSLRVIRSDLRYKITALFNENGVVIAFPQTDIHVDGSLKLES